ncbi:MAG: 4-alpha-glucanotransferase [Beduini sp.]|uniref:4-alpha-glucanotransferase n=1 Tax=Beduini sp. TaxID=1922300 RepID=UPI0039904625
MKKAGILLPIFSLPSIDGVGTFGKSAYEFVDYMKASGLHYWQILPLNPLDSSYSPYQTISSFAGETVYIDLTLLKENGLLEEIEWERFDSHWADYRRVKIFKEPYFKQAFENFTPDHRWYPDFELFKEKTWWLNHFCEFKVLYRTNNKNEWSTWQQFEIDDTLKEFEAFKQYLFYRQWQELKKYANDKGIEVIGDLPFYVGYNSEDVYFNKQLFKLDENNQPSCVSGVPPDYFNPDGQRWNHPIYNWEALEKEHFNYWIDKILQACQTVDMLRLDHFRAFDTYWQVDVHSVGARDGAWQEAPGHALFTELFNRYPNLNLIVEDLGYLREEVYQLKDRFGFMGMKIMQFSFEETLNHQIPENCLYYTGTHDNDTLLGWMTEENIDYSIDELLEMALATAAEVVIIPLQDFLGLDDSSRINSPGTIGTQNWTWRIDSLEDFAEKSESIKAMLERAQRI